jgi:hypothetical protein
MTTHRSLFEFEIHCRLAHDDFERLQSLTDDLGTNTVTLKH